MCGGDIPIVGEQAEAVPASIPNTFQTADAHCHPTDTLASLKNISSQNTTFMCCMSTSFHDLDHVASLYREHPTKVVPAFGFHPWKYNEIASTAEVMTPEQALEAFSPEDADLAAKLIENQRPLQEWTTILTEYLTSHPKAIMGEVGMDRAASLPNTNFRLKLNQEHQSKIFEAQLRIAGRLKRPVSCHCVRAHGLMINMFKRIGKESIEEFPPAICMHSYNGEPDTIKTLLKIPKIGNRIYVSFSTVINGGKSEKLEKRIRAVPEDRLLIESDYNTMDAIDLQIAQIAHVVAEARGWTLEETCVKTFQNFLRFSNVD
ncbi:hypothetical protein SmJEL517_g00662 [Synchytrium microbalum]|uniref:TatD DNase family protein n=1 Tax=Synchytrium microbalum TaxID=1806994 RepID=A0A507C7H9_9FUNG|nr:uncharacterized protein SmJEL517_g00662 [Synchytrium microbalum]TPX37530.1 hypothetical protein SmJEL517_g00662 [Synchytrium microbalum]